MEEIKDIIRLRGAIQYALHDPDGKAILEGSINNLVVSQGRLFALVQLISTSLGSTGLINYFGIGSGAVAPTSNDATLGAEVMRKSVASFTTNFVSPGIGCQVTFATSDANTTLSEVGLFGTSSGSPIFSRATFASFVKATSNTLAITYNISA